MLVEFGKLSPTETPKYLSSDIDNKIDLLKREMNYLIGKAQRFVPKPKTTTTTPKVPVNNETDADENPEDPSSTTTTTSATPTDEDNEDNEDKETTTPPPEEGKTIRRIFRDNEHSSL